jgi:hypothetical protein
MADETQAKDLHRIGFNTRSYGGVVIGTKYDDSGYNEVQWDTLHQKGWFRRIEAEIDPETGKIAEARYAQFGNFQQLVRYAKEFVVT